MSTDAARKLHTRTHMLHLRLGTLQSDIATAKLFAKLAHIIAHNVSKIAAEWAATNKTEAHHHQ